MQDLNMWMFCILFSIGSKYCFIYIIIHFKAVYALFYLHDCFWIIRIQVFSVLLRNQKAFFSPKNQVIKKCCGFLSFIYRMLSFLEDDSRISNLWGLVNRICYSLRYHPLRYRINCNEIVSRLFHVSWA